MECIHQNKYHLNICRQIRIGTRDKPEKKQYTLGYPCTPLASTIQEKDIRVIIDSKPSFEQHNYLCIQHCHFVNSTQISDVIKRLRFAKSDGIDNLY